jgi:hypothetical protein
MTRAAALIALVREWPEPVIDTGADTLEGAVEYFLAAEPEAFLVFGPCDSRTPEGKCAGHRKQAGPLAQDGQRDLAEVVPDA